MSAERLAMLLAIAAMYDGTHGTHTEEELSERLKQDAERERRRSDYEAEALARGKANYEAGAEVYRAKRRAAKREMWDKLHKG